MWPRSGLGLSHRVRIVGHDIGTMVAYSYAAAHPHDVVKLVLSEAPIPDPSIYTFPALTAHGPGLWWFGLFAEPNRLAEHLLAGKEKLFVADFIPTLEVVKGAVTSCDMAVYAHFLAQPGHLRASIEWFATLPHDVRNDAIYSRAKLTMPVLAIGQPGQLRSSQRPPVRHPRHWRGHPGLRPLDLRGAPSRAHQDPAAVPAVSTPAVRQGRRYDEPE